MFLEFDETPVTPDDDIACLQEIDRIEARLHALRADLLVKVADPVARVDEFWVLTPGSDEEKCLRIADVVREELGCALRRPHVTVQGMIDTARLLCGPLAATKDALAAGAISMDHVRAIVDAAVQLPGHCMRDDAEVQEFTTGCRFLQERVLPVAMRGTIVNTRKSARSAVHAIDPEGVSRRRREAKCTRDVWVTAEQDGMSLLIARLATEKAIALKVQIDGAAFDRAYSPDASAGLTMGEHRVEALAAMVLGCADDVEVGTSTEKAPVLPVTNAHVNLTIDLPTFLGLQANPGVGGFADLLGDGPVSVEVIRELLADPACQVTMRRLITDPLTGHLLDCGRRTYEIPQALRDFIVQRDQKCRFPGCNRRADLGQIDHAIAWDDGGTTSPQNLGALCIRHHQLKTFGGWEITAAKSDGSCHWRSPGGRIYYVKPPPQSEPDLRRHGDHDKQRKPDHGPDPVDPPF